MDVSETKATKRAPSKDLTVFGVVIGEGGGVIGVGGIPAQLSALGVIHCDGILYRGDKQQGRIHKTIIFCVLMLPTQSGDPFDKEAFESSFQLSYVTCTNGRF